MTPLPDCSAASDQDLVAWAREGREEAYVELFRRTHRTVRGLLRRMVRDDDLADDLTQETFVRAFDALATQPPDGNFGPWILRIANNLGMDHWRAEGRRRRRGHDTVPLEPTPDVTSPRRLRATRLRSTLAPTPTPTPTPRDARALGLARELEDALAQLKETYRRCFVLREIEGRSYDDIAELLDLPVGTVGPFLTRARRELRAALRSRHDALGASSPTPA
jgi:RNA polymerase sigma-70 factor (ECF subfamily)